MQKILSFAKKTYKFPYTMYKSFMLGKALGENKLLNFSDATLMSVLREVMYKYRNSDNVDAAYAMFVRRCKASTSKHMHEYDPESWPTAFKRQFAKRKEWARKYARTVNERKFLKKQMKDLEAYYRS